jgi:predicted transcriptional regulator of viral defense system
MQTKSRTPWPRVVELAAKQHGVVALRQLTRLGMQPGAVKHQVRAGRLHRLYRGVYAVGRPDVTRHGRWMAAVLACGPDAVLSHRSAANLWQLNVGGSLSR